MTWNVNPTSEEFGFLMEAGLMYRDARQYDKARELLTGVQALLQKTTEAVEVVLGTVSFQEGDFETASKHYYRALELNPRSAYAYAHLGELSIFQMDKEKAREHLKKAIELDPRGTFGKLARNLQALSDVVQFKQAM